MDELLLYNMNSKIIEKFNTAFPANTVCDIKCLHILDGYLFSNAYLTNEFGIKPLYEMNEILKLQKFWLLVIHVDITILVA